MSTKTEIESTIAEMTSMIETIEATGGDASMYHRIVDASYKELTDAVEAERLANTDRSHSLTARPKAGSAARNQYGTFSVCYASQKQTNYIKFLLDTRDVAQADGSKIDIAALRQQVAATQVNKKAASAIIDFLLELPEPPKQAPVPTGSLGAPATDRQKTFVRTLLGEREGNPAIAPIREALNVAREHSLLTAELVSSAIDQLLAIPANGTQVPEGRYALPAEDGHFVFYKVDCPTSGNWAGYTFVSQLIGSVGDWNEQRLSRQVSESVKARIAVNVEEAARMFGIKAKACSYCSSPLSNVQSRAAGYGETCAHNHGFYYPTEAEALEILAERGES